VKSLGKEGIFFKSDERILGDSDFAADVPAKADEAMERKTAPASQGVDLRRVMDLGRPLDPIIILDLIPLRENATNSMDKRYGYVECM